MWLQVACRERRLQRQKGEFAELASAGDTDWSGSLHVHWSRCGEVEVMKIGMKSISIFESLFMMNCC